MEKSVAIFVAINYALLGLSHILQRDAWKEFFAVLHSHGRAGALFNGLLALFIGSIIVGFHNNWSGYPVLLTLIGWANLVKAAVVLLAPNLGLASMAKVQTSSDRKLIVVGAGLIVVACLIGASVLGGSYEQ